MEKIIYPLWKASDQSIAEFKNTLLNGLSKELLSINNLRHLKIAIADEHVEAAKPYCMKTLHQCLPDAVLFIWVDSSVYLNEIEGILVSYAANYSGYSVTESEPLKSDCGDKGQKSPGMLQVVFLQQPDRLTKEQWLNIWFQQHTPVAIATQSTFGYRQNVVSRAITNHSLALDAIVEENFPEAAIDSREAFYDAQGNEALYKEREQAMIASCAAFIDFTKIDCIPMSEYGFK